MWATFWLFCSTNPWPSFKRPFSVSHTHTFTSQWEQGWGMRLWPSDGWGVDKVGRLRELSLCLFFLLFCWGGECVTSMVVLKYSIQTCVFVYMCALPTVHTPQRGSNHLKHLIARGPPTSYKWHQCTSACGCLYTYEHTAEKLGRLHVCCYCVFQVCSVNFCTSRKTGYAG